MSRMECPWCGKWRCRHCGRVRYYTERDEEVVRCTQCGRSDGELEGVVHTNPSIADEHLYLAQVDAAPDRPKKRNSTVDEDIERLDNAISEALCEVEWMPWSVRYAMARSVRKKLGLTVKQWIDMPSDFPFADCVITHGHDGVEVMDEFGRDVTDQYRAWTAEQNVTYKVEGEL